MMLQVHPGLPIVPIVQLGYLLMGLCVLAGMAVLAWDGRTFLGHPASPRDRHHREYARSLASAVWKLGSAVLAAITAGMSFVLLAWTMS